MKKIFITRKLPDIAKKLLEAQFEVHSNDKNTVLPADELLKKVKTYHAILSTILDKFTKKILKQANNLEVISNYAVGLDNIDLNYAKSKKIAIYNTPDVVTNSTADLTMALLLSFARKIDSAREHILKGKWKEWDPYLMLGNELCNKTFGIIGFGRIGQAVAKRALGFSINIVYFNDISPTIHEPDIVNKVKKVTLSELLKHSDIISIHAPLTNETKHLINKESIKHMQKKPILLNLARGPIVNTEDLLHALKQEKISGACLDVTDPEPIPKNHPLLKLKNCLIVPHIGTATVECRYNMAKMAAENIIRHFTQKTF